MPREASGMLWGGALRGIGEVSGRHRGGIGEVSEGASGRQGPKVPKKLPPSIEGGGILLPPPIEGGQSDPSLKNKAFEVHRSQLRSGQKYGPPLN